MVSELSSVLGALMGALARESSSGNYGMQRRVDDLKREILVHHRYGKSVSPARLKAAFFLAAIMYLIPASERRPLIQELGEFNVEYVNGGMISLKELASRSERIYVFEESTHLEKLGRYQSDEVWWMHEGRDSFLARVIQRRGMPVIRAFDDAGWNFAITELHMVDEYCSARGVEVRRIRTFESLLPFVSSDCVTDISPDVARSIGAVVRFASFTRLSGLKRYAKYAGFRIGKEIWLNTDRTSMARLAASPRAWVEGGRGCAVAEFFLGHFDRMLEDVLDDSQ